MRLHTARGERPEAELALVSAIMDFMACNLMSYFCRVTLRMMGLVSLLNIEE